ncbi:MAG: tetratricopeptide repeat protein [bacterium]
MKQLVISMAGGLLLLLAGPGFAAPPTTAPIANDPGWERGRLLKNGLSDVETAEREAAAGHYKPAAKLFDAGFEAAETVAGRAYALRRVAECQYLNENYFKAQKSYKRLLEGYAPYLPLENVLKVQRELADLLATGKASALNFRNVELAIEVYETILSVAPGGANAPADLSALARLQKTAGNTAEAVDTLRELIRRFPRTTAEESAHLEIARLLVEQGRYGDGDGRYNRGARQEMRLFIADRPDSPRVGEAQQILAGANEAMAQRLVDMGFFYLRKYSYRPNTARRYFYDAVRLYPGTKAAKIAQRQLDIMEPGAGAAAAEEAAKKPEPPPEPVRWLDQQEKVDKYLLPLEDYSDYLRNSHAARDAAKKAGAETPAKSK